MPVTQRRRSAEDERLHDIAQNPDDPKRRAVAEAIFAAIESRDTPIAADARLLADHALAWAALGFSARARAVFRRWRKVRAPRDFARVTAQAEAIFLVCTDPAAASVAFRDLALEDVKTAALYVVSAVNRGDLRAAIDVARRHAFFPQMKAVPHACMYGLWSLVLCCEFDEARNIVEAQRRTATRDKTIALSRLRNEALVAAYRCAYAEERHALEEAAALAGEGPTGIERAHIDLALAANEVRSGDLALARRRMKSWSAPVAGDVALDRYRDMVRMDEAMFDAKHAIAERLARQVLGYAENAGSAMLACHLRFCLALSADAKHFANALAEYRHDVHRLQAPHHLRRLRLIEAIAADADLRTLRDVRIRLRTRQGTTEQPLARLWTPTLDAVASDLYWNRAEEQLWLRGEGPYSLEDQPIVRRILEALLSAPGHAKPYAELFTAVWDAPYHPLAHDGKINVAVHRLRRWLDARHAGASRWIEVDGGVLRIAREVGPAVASIETTVPPRRGALADRVIECLESARTGGGMSPADLERRLGCSRAALNRSLRMLVVAGSVVADGAGSNLRYTAARRAGMAR
jgi:hypothetical protein